ncbi:DUF397 domain-containing protein [Streptomyces sp. NPDC002742]|uniref:DUF397 domain-containing protein n=1 Tax=Streptomyces sp. NPDC002742 TaxID=3364663 RepID=UPI0036D055E5
MSTVPEPVWFKSSYSSGEGGECVEVADRPGIVHVRDSKAGAGPVLSFASGRWAAFIEFAAQD